MNSTTLNGQVQAGNSNASEEIRDNWVESVTDLAHDVETWAKERGWAISQEDHQQKEAPIGWYTIPRLEIDAHVEIGVPGGKLKIEPVGRFVPEGDGRVDIYAWPTHWRVLLLRKGDDWVIRTESGLDWPQPWSRDSFLTVAEGLMKAR
jgi:hypothetical protein